MNRLVACAIHLHPEQRAWFSFLRCLEDRPTYTIEGAVGQCAEEAGFDLGELQECQAGALGDQLEAQAEAETAALVPPHEYVPWVSAGLGEGRPGGRGLAVGGAGVGTSPRAAP